MELDMNAVFCFYGKSCCSEIYSLTEAPELLIGRFCNPRQLILFLFAAATLCLDFIKWCRDKEGWLYWIRENIFIEVIKPLRPQWDFISHGFVSFQMTGNCPWRSSSLTSPMVSSLMNRCRSCITPSTGSKQSKLIFLLDISRLQLKPLLLTCCLALKCQHFASIFHSKT